MGGGQVDVERNSQSVQARKHWGSWGGNVRTVVENFVGSNGFWVPSNMARMVFGYP